MTLRQTCDCSNWVGPTELELSETLRGLIANLGTNARTDMHAARTICLPSLSRGR